MSENSGDGRHPLKTTVMNTRNSKYIENVLYKQPRFGNLSQVLNTVIDDYYFVPDEIVAPESDTHVNLMLLGVG